MKTCLSLLAFLVSGVVCAQCPSLELEEPVDGVEAFPLEHTAVEVIIEGPIARVEVRQRFTNPFDEAVEAIYAIPMSVRAAVNGYAFDIGSRSIVGEIKTREAARTAYNAAKAEGKTAALLEQAKENIFLQSIANIPPGEAVEVRFQYVEFLDYRQEDGWRFTFPLSITDRFLPPDHQDRQPIDGNAPPGVSATDLYRSGQDLDVSVRIEAGANIHGIDGGVHAIVSDVNDHRATVKLAEADTIPNEDFVLRFRASAPQSKPTVFSQQNPDGTGYFTLLVQPQEQFVPEEIAAREIVLIFDVSSSMRGVHSISQFIGKELIASATEKDFINVITFAGRSGRWASTSQPATAENKAAATQLINGLSTGGGTYMKKGALAAYATAPPPGATRHIFVLTDGAIGNEDEVLAAFRTPEGNNRIFPIGISAAPNMSLIERIAHKGRGFTSYLYSIEDAQKQAQVILRRTSAPLMTNIDIDWGDLPVRDFAPSVTPDLFYGLPLVVSGQFDAPASGQVIIRGEQGGRPVELPIQVDLASDDEREAIPYVWARRRIAELTAAEDALWNEDVEAEVTRLGLKFSLVTAFTSFVAVDNGQNDGALEQPAPHSGAFYASDAATCAQVRLGGRETGWAWMILLGAIGWRRRVR